MTTETVAQLPATRSVVADMAKRFGMERAAFEATIKKTIMPADVSNEQMVAFLLVAKEYDLSPFTKEIYAFPARGGGIQPIVSIDGWLKIINSHPKFNGMEFKDERDASGSLLAVTCKIFRKDRDHPIEVTEYMAECRRDTDTWKRWPARMLRHKAAIQCARYAFGFSGIIDPDEAERFADVGAVSTPAAQSADLAFYSEEDFEKNLASWRPHLETGRMRADDIIAKVESKALMTDEQKATLRNIKSTSGESHEND